MLNLWSVLENGFFLQSGFSTFLVQLQNTSERGKDIYPENSQGLPESSCQSKSKGPCVGWTVVREHLPGKKARQGKGLTPSADPTGNGYMLCVT